MPFSKDPPICGFCIGEAYLGSQIRRQGKVKFCSVCGVNRRTWSLQEVALEVDSVFREYYFPAGQGGGAYPEDIISEMLEVDDHEVAEFIVEFLHEAELRDIADGADAQYDNTSYYAMIDLYPWELHSKWEEFCRQVRFGQRFFDQTAKALLDDILEPIKHINSLGVSAPVVTLGPDESMPEIFRARVARDLAQARVFMDDPAEKLYAPDPRKGRSGRLNPVGLPVFYGAFSRKTAVAEVRPPVGSLVVTAAFRPTRDLKVLDLSGFQRDWPFLSIFDPGFVVEVERWRFLTDFQKLVSQPVHPDVEGIEYIPTQAVADYIHFELGYAGVIYPSAQTNSESWEDAPSTDQNVAFLRTASAAEIGGPTPFELQLESIASFPGLLGRETELDGAESPIREDTTHSPLLAFVEGSVEVDSVRGIAFELEREFLI